MTRVIGIALLIFRNDHIQGQLYKSFLQKRKHQIVKTNSITLKKVKKIGGKKNLIYSKYEKFIVQVPSRQFQHSLTKGIDVSQKERSVVH